MVTKEDINTEQWKSKRKRLSKEMNLLVVPVVLLVRL